LPFELRYHLPLLLIRKEVISLPGYVWYGNNRKPISKRAIRGSGDILLKDWAIHQCDIDVLDSSFKGILRLQLTNKQTPNVSSVYVLPTAKQFT